MRRTPEMASTRLDFPALWFPMTTMRGSSRSMWALRVASRQQRGARAERTWTCPRERRSATMSMSSLEDFA